MVESATGRERRGEPTHCHWYDSYCSGWRPPSNRPHCSRQRLGQDACEVRNLLCQGHKMSHNVPWKNEGYCIHVAADYADCASTVVFACWISCGGSRKKTFLSRKVPHRKMSLSPPPQITKVGRVTSFKLSPFSYNSKATFVDYIYLDIYPISTQILFHFTLCFRVEIDSDSTTTQKLFALQQRLLGRLSPLMQ